MKKIIIALLFACSICGLESRQPNTINIDDSGVVTKGSSKLSNKNYDLIKNSYSNRKPSKYEITDIDPRQSK